MRASGVQLAKLAGTYQVPQAEPHGSAFDAQGRLFTSSVGNQGFGSGKGQLFLWFPPYEGYPGPANAYPSAGAASNRFCKLAADIATAGGLAIDSAGRVCVTSAGRGVIERFAPPFPTGLDASEGCGGEAPVGSPFVTMIEREVFASGWYTFSGLAFAPNGHLFASSVFTGEIIELDASGADLDLTWDLPSLGPGSDGKVWRLRFDEAGAQ